MNLFNFIRGRLIGVYLAWLCAGLVFGGGLFVASNIDKGQKHAPVVVLVLFLVAVWVFFTVFRRVSRALINSGNRQIEADQRAADEARWEHEQEWHRNHP